MTLPQTPLPPVSSHAGDRDLADLAIKVDANRKAINALGVQTAARFDRVDARFEQVDQGFADIRARFDQVEAGLQLIVDLLTPGPAPPRPDSTTTTARNLANQVRAVVDMWRCYFALRRPPVSTIPIQGRITAVAPALSLETGATEAPPLTPRPAG